MFINTPFLSVLTMIILSFFLSCTLVPKKISSVEKYVTESGFAFEFPMSGEWFQAGPEQNGQYIVGKKPTPEGTSTLAVVRHGSVWRPNNKAISNAEILNGFQKNIEADSKIGRVKNITSQFRRLKYKKADCLSFEQSGIDSAPNTSLHILNDGLICIHPNIAYNFIWMALTQRSPKNIIRSDLDSDKTLFFDSLSFPNTHQQNIR